MYNKKIEKEFQEAYTPQSQENLNAYYSKINKFEHDFLTWALFLGELEHVNVEICYFLYLLLKMYFHIIDMW